MAARVTAVINQKGGVGKTSTADALWAGLQLRGLKVLAVDLDPQGSFTFSAGITAAPGSASSFGLLSGGTTPKQTVHHLERGDVIPASRALAGIDAVIEGTGREYRLREALTPLLDDYDHVVLDTPPSLGLLTINALTAADGVVVPCNAEPYSIQGVGHLGEEIATVRRYCNHGLKVDGLLLTRHQGRALVSRSLTPFAERMAATLGSRVFKATIREAVAVKEAQLAGQSVFDVQPKGKAAVAADYSAFIDEFLEVIHG